jgi:thioredoxin-dependent peroxiredoxin
VRPLLAAALCALVACSKETPAPKAAPAAAIEERSGVIYRDDKALTLLGPDLAVGSAAPDFTVVGPGFEEVHLKDFAGKTVILSVVPSIDTPVCEAQTGRLASEEPKLPPNTALLTVSRDLPYAQRRFLSDNRLSTRIASDYKEGTFGRAWGVLIKETGLLARSVWIIDKSGKVAYRELVNQQGTPPNYDALFAALAKLEGASAQK